MKVADDKSINSHTTVCDESRWQTTTYQPTNGGSSKGKRWLVRRPPEGSGRGLAAKAVNDKSVNGV